MHDYAVVTKHSFSRAEEGLIDIEVKEKVRVEELVVFCCFVHSVVKKKMRTQIEKNACSDKTHFFFFSSGPHKIEQSEL